MDWHVDWHLDWHLDWHVDWYANWHALAGRIDPGEPCCCYCYTQKQHSGHIVYILRAVRPVRL